MSYKQESAWSAGQPSAIQIQKQIRVMLYALRLATMAKLANNKRRGSWSIQRMSRMVTTAGDVECMSANVSAGTP